MKKKLSPILTLLLALLAAFFGYNGLTEDTLPVTPDTSLTETMAYTDSAPETDDLLDPDGSYTTKEDVALYIHTYGTQHGRNIDNTTLMGL